jgi:hypothetical protein
MLRRVAIVIALWCALCAAPARAATGRAGTPAPARAKSAAPAKARTPELPRTLADVHIEGETPVPQVLFITARDQRRFADFQHHRYLKTSRQLGDPSVLPTWILVNPNPTPSGKESTR